MMFPKSVLVRSEPYRRLVAALPCANCGIHGYSQAAHPPPSGKGIKQTDLDCVPLCCVHPGPDGQLVTGCHSDLDQYRLLPKDDIPAMMAYWKEDTQRKIIRDGSWPRSLPKPDLEM